MITVPRLNATLTLARALTLRGIREQGRWIVINPLLLAAFFLLLVGAALYAPVILTGPTRHAIEVGAARYGTHRETAVALSVIINQAPYFIALVGALVGSTLAQSLVGQESNRGGIELLLSAPYRLSEVVWSLLLVAFTLTAISWLGLSLVSVAGSAALLAAMHATLPIGGGRIALLLLFPLPLAYLSNLIGVILSIVFPRAAQMRTGGFNLFQYMAIAPSLIVMIVANFWPSLNPFAIAATAMAAGLAGSVLAMAIVGRLFNPSALLAS
jgi:ABC-type transport system involved in multi-copper enzyme maturation permease subunit